MPSCSSQYTRTRGEQPLDGFQPEPIIDDPAVGTDPEHEVLLADSVGIALQVVPDTLSPAERLAFVLHEMFSFRAVRSPGPGQRYRRRGRFDGERPFAVLASTILGDRAWDRSLLRPSPRSQLNSG